MDSQKNINKQKGTTTLKVKSKKKRCAYINCHKKLQLTDMSCHCKSIFCYLHRLPETHNCSWNPKDDIEMSKYKDMAGLNHAILCSKMERI